MFREKNRAFGGRDDKKHADSRPLITHVISSLGSGGAEATLVKVALGVKGFRHRVISLTAGGMNQSLLSKNGIEVLSFRGGRALVLFHFLRIVREFKSRPPDIVQTWMYHSDLLGGLAAKFVGVENIAWNIRHSNLTRSSVGISTILVAKVCALLSRWVPRIIVVSSESAAATHARLGYAHPYFVNIPNGVDVRRFAPSGRLFSDGDASESKRVRPLRVLIVGRYAPQKAIPATLRALSKFSSSDVYIVIAGQGIDQSNAELVEIVEAYGLQKSVELRGEQERIEELFSNADLLISGSQDGESFPNVVAEALASGIPAIATDVGDSARIVGSAGWIVPPKSESDLIRAISKSLEEHRNGTLHDRGIRGRRYIVENFNIEKMLEQYKDLYSKLLRQ